MIFYQCISLQVGALQLDLDNHQLMKLEHSKLSSSFNSTELRKEREAFPELTQGINRAWKLSVASWDISFPYKYNFSEAFQEDFVSLVKWLKSVHRKAKTASGTIEINTESSREEGQNIQDVKEQETLLPPPLPPDIILSIKKWLVTVEDDPFEVKLRYNYELMEDEYRESCKRNKAFNARVQELQRSYAFLTAEKIDELHQSLKEKDSETYIKRSKQMYETTPVRSAVFTWLVEDALIFALADPTMNGVTNAINNLQDIDPAS